ncbi:MAG: hypothetical protein HOC91_08075 [Nitrospinaceae bacterium]|jgi:type II secretory pathway component PulM|nr:hypothetical protein [Nitrospinaceae bacterium]MBT3432849.1 hypothetical protein [Nitrospinaceae bacterium]MBT3819911.1 hypothetical protein [Nitrospinaceae bacterium]MBT4092820.1 hypothetical protein [Nitrospinaceae bacterium]MBT4430455.1 hypothetical protein [Nitrospinaceae bacterium]
MKLSKREYVFMAIGASLVFVLALSEFFVRPYWTRHQELEKKVSRLDNELRQVRRLLVRFKQNRKLLKDVEKRLIHEGDSFSLFSFLEEAAGQVGIRSRLTSMSPSQGDAANGYRRHEMSIRFEGLSVGELVRFLEYLEKAPKLVRVERLRIDRSSRKPGRVKVSAKVITFAIQATGD